MTEEFIKRKKVTLKKKNLIIGITFLLIFVLILVMLFDKKEENKSDGGKKTEESEVYINENPTIINPNSNSRPIAIMINNLSLARTYHSGIQDAFLVYEMIVEGGLTRLMAVYKDAGTAKIGSVRSSRHYFLDYAMENDAIYVHFGWSPQAQQDISLYNVNNLNGLYDNFYWRDTSLNIPVEHTAFTSMEKIQNDISSKNYRKTTDKKTLLNYVKETDLSKKDGAIPVNSISIRYSTVVETSYIYDTENKLYKRYVNGQEHSDYLTKEQYTAKNIITYQVSNSTIIGDDKGRQNFENLGSGDGYYISNGFAIPIKWYKNSRDSQTKYTYLDGQEIEVNDGNTFIQIQPTGQVLNLE